MGIKNFQDVKKEKRKGLHLDNCRFTRIHKYLQLVRKWSTNLAAVLLNQLNAHIGLTLHTFVLDRKYFVTLSDNFIIWFSAILTNKVYEK